MAPLFVTLFAIIDSKFWSVEEVRVWADGLLVQAECPADWLLGLSSARTLDDALTTVRNALERYNLILPEDFGDALAGFIYLKYEQGRLERGQMVAELVDATDAYEPSQFDVEDVQELKRAPMDEESSLSRRLHRLAVRSAQLDYDLRSQDLYEKERNYIDG